MNKYEAKYKALSVGCTDEQIKIAESLVRVATDMSCNHPTIPFELIFRAFLASVMALQSKDAFAVLTDS